jgi:hypothetical protein
LGTVSWLPVHCEPIQKNVLTPSFEDSHEYAANAPRPTPRTASRGQDSTRSLRDGSADLGGKFSCTHGPSRRRVVGGAAPALRSFRSPGTPEGRERELDQARTSADLTSDTDHDFLEPPPAEFRAQPLSNCYALFSRCADLLAVESEEIVEFDTSDCDEISGRSCLIIGTDEIHILGGARAFSLSRLLKNT